MYCHNFQIVLQEVPGEISLCFSISGCSIQCQGCHSPFLWKEKSGKILTEQYYTSLLDLYGGMASCILFMGGEWHEEELIRNLQLAKRKNFKTCLYTGEENVSKEILSELTWIKTGKWNAKLGGLDSETTNQKYIEIKSNKIFNHLFHKN